MNGPHSKESGAQFSGLKDFAKPSGRLIVTGTQMASSSSPLPMTPLATAALLHCARIAAGCFCAHAAVGVGGCHE